MTSSPITAEELTRCAAARWGRLRLPDEQRDGAGPSARLLGDDRRLALSHDVSRPGQALTAADIQAVARARPSPATRGPSGTSMPSDGGGPTAAPPREASARVERPTRGDRPIRLRSHAGRSGAQPPRPRFSLDNGISVIVQENHATPTVALRASVPAGSLADPSRQARSGGITAAAMLSRGTVPQRSALAFATALEDVGGEPRGGAPTRSSPRSQAETLTRTSTSSSDLFTEMLRQPAFPAADFDRTQERGARRRRPGEDESGPHRELSTSTGPSIRRGTLSARRRSRTRSRRSPRSPGTTSRTSIGGSTAWIGMIVVVTGTSHPTRSGRSKKRLGDWSRNPETRAIAS